jgi:hypothetical protein
MRGPSDRLLGSDREWEALNRLDSLCRSKGWRISLRADHDEQAKGPIRTRTADEEMTVVSYLHVVECSHEHELREERHDETFRRHDRELIARASIPSGDGRIGHAAEALTAHMTRQGLFVFDQEQS